MALPRLRSVDDPAPLAAFLEGASLEVMPRTAEKITDLRGLLPAGGQVFVAHIDGTAPQAMQATVSRIAAAGLTPVPHIPARVVPSREALAAWVGAYRAAGARHALLLGGGLPRPAGPYADSLQLLETGLFDGFDGLFVAGHPEGNRDIDPDGSERNVMAALHAKQEWSRRKGVPLTVVTQFLFEADPAIAWTERLASAGIDLPIRLGLAGPTKLQTLIKYAIACGVGPSLRVLQRRSRDLTKLLVPVTPDDLALAFARHKAANPGWRVEAAHLFPLGGIAPAAEWLTHNR
ncbi:methylenetetrahydrofolate reductase [Paracoccus sp. S-4012]|uniref:methylenetetrahydrofolate reductase n=1 Tax=Paracoccus sp. S-4012 TaxID=2665648 RepID=UPI0012B03CD0|nr:methylenetetrahydrofolate reductase [Paracoccus sp. S-4012]MRX49619.1 methylenetetrahydrofolate reductase [Paracoccus sp. S-4012]